MPATGAVIPNGSTPPDVATAMKQLRLVQYAIPAVTGALFVLGAQQGEDQKPEEQARGLGRFSRH